MKAVFWVKMKVKEEPYGPKPRPFVLNGPPQCTINKPKTRQDEFAFKLNFIVPDSYFRTPDIKIDIEMPDAQTDFVLTSDVQENLSQIIKEQLGVKAHICLGGEENDNN